MISKARSGIAREVAIPDKAKISFTANWRSSPYFRILFFSDDGSDDYPGTGYSLNIQRTYLSVYRNAPNDRNNDIISESIRNMLEAETAEFTRKMKIREKYYNCNFTNDESSDHITTKRQCLINTVVKV